MTEEEYETLGLIRTRKVYGDGTTFTHHGRDMSARVLWAFSEGYAENDVERPADPVKLTGEGRKAYGDYVTPAERLLMKEIEVTLTETEEGS